METSECVPTLWAFCYNSGGSCKLSFGYFEGPAWYIAWACPPWEGTLGSQEVAFCILNISVYQWICLNQSMRFASDLMLLIKSTLKEEAVCD